MFGTRHDSGDCRTPSPPSGSPRGADGPAASGARALRGRPGAQRLAGAGLLVAAALAVAGCGSSGDLAGTVSVSGSTTLLPYVGAVARDFAQQNPLTQFQVNMIGTDDGFAQLCNGLTDVAGASAPLDATDRAQCVAEGIGIARLTVARDAVVIFSNRSHTTPACLSLADLYALTGPESGSLRTWRQAARVATRLGSRTSLPARPLTVIAPQEGQGTRTFYLGTVIAPIAERRGRTPTLTPTAIAEPSNSVMLNAVLHTADPLAFVGYATTRSWGPSVRVLAVNAGRGCVVPSPATIRSGAYPLSRPLYIYVNRGRAAASPTVTAFVDALVSTPALTDVAAATAVALTDQQIRATQQTWRQSGVPTWGPTG